MSLYDIVVHSGYPLRRWARLEVHGRELLPATGPVIVVANHDSMLDPLAVAAACHPVRYLRFLAMAELWRNPVFKLLLDGMGHIPTVRGGGGNKAISHAVQALEQGEAIGIFPEGGLSHGHRLRARRGVGVLSAVCPSAPILLAAVSGADDVVRFPRRPRARVMFLAPAPESSPPVDEAQAAQRWLDQVRSVVPPTAAGRPGRVPARLRERRERRQAAARASRPPRPPSA